VAGEADTNQDGKITVVEMQDYLSDKVLTQAMTFNRKQSTQLVGDANRISAAQRFKLEKIFRNQNQNKAR
jgi:plasmid maintenance system antidote protein VapI